MELTLKEAAVRNKKKVKLMLDYYSWPIWAPAELDNIDPGTLPISRQLADDLISSAKLYDSGLNSEYPPDSHSLEAERDRISEEGKRLYEQLSRELSSEDPSSSWEVVYHAPF